jgi:hypothetical protein
MGTGEIDQGYGWIGQESPLLFIGMNVEKVYPKFMEVVGLFVIFLNRNLCFYKNPLLYRFYAESIMHRVAQLPVVNIHSL